MAEGLAQRLAAAEAEGEPRAAAAQLRDIVAGQHPNDAESLKVKEAALQKLTGLLVQQEDAAALRSLLTDLRPLFAAIPKAKTAKIVRTIIDSIAKVPNSTALLVRGGEQGFCCTFAAREVCRAGQHLSSACCTTAQPTLA
jgi:26S proteasome regulatory subunit N6